VPTPRLFVVSNRLPIVVEQSPEGQTLRPGAGGLVTALAPIMERHGGVWIGWPGHAGMELDTALLEKFARKHAYNLHPVPLSEEEVHGYYEGFSNESLWPLFHDLLGHCRFEQANWNTYEAVNRRFAEHIMTSEAAARDFVWIHDYQLLLVARELRRRGFGAPLAFFLHIPFPSPDIFRRLPWRQDVIAALMDYDLLGFQTLRDRRNFVGCVKSCLGNVKVRVHRRVSRIEYQGRTVTVGNFPIGIDFDEFNGPARSPEVEEEARRFRDSFNVEQIVIGIDRLDYTKGIPQRFLAYERCIEKYPELRGRIALFQLVVPSRSDVEEYQELRGRIEQLVGHINGRFSESGWIPIHYQYGTLDRPQLLGCYRACDIALITPLRDGMNLVAKEYCACQTDSDGVLIVSEFAGTADQLRNGSLIVNPFDREGLADTIHRAFMMDRRERFNRMNALRSEVKRHNVHVWVRWFLDALRLESLEGPQAPHRRSMRLAAR
jgi:trehalose 6-phosphate synthase/phosphatase